VPGAPDSDFWPRLAWTTRLSKNGKRRFRGKVTARVTVEDQVLKVAVPEGSRFKGREPFLLQTW